MCHLLLKKLNLSYAPSCFGPEIDSLGSHSFFQPNFKLPNCGILDRFALSTLRRAVDRTPSEAGCGLWIRGFVMRDCHSILTFSNLHSAKD